MISVVLVRALRRSQCSWWCSAASSLSRMYEERSSLSQLTSANEGAQTESECTERQQAAQAEPPTRPPYHTTARYLHLDIAKHPLRGGGEVLSRSASDRLLRCATDLMSGCPKMSLCPWKSTRPNAPAITSMIGYVCETKGGRRSTAEGQLTGATSEPLPPAVASLVARTASSDSQFLRNAPALSGLTIFDCFTLPERVQQQQQQQQAKRRSALLLRCSPPTASCAAVDLLPAAAGAALDSSVRAKRKDIFLGGCCSPVVSTQEGKQMLP